jgi:prophage regulatory protein
VDRVLSLEDLSALGIKFTRPYLYTLMKQGLFPRPIKLGARTNGWFESEIRQYLEDRKAARDKELQAV